MKVPVLSVRKVDVLTFFLSVEISILVRVYCCGISENSPPCPKRRSRCFLTNLPFNVMPLSTSWKSSISGRVSSSQSYDVHPCVSITRSRCALRFLFSMSKYWAASGMNPLSSDPNSIYVYILWLYDVFWFAMASLTLSEILLPSVIGLPSSRFTLIVIFWLGVSDALCT